MNKKIYIVPGFGETTRMKNYREIMSFAKKSGFEVESVKINWDMDKTISDYMVEFQNQIPVETNSYILGFSFGSFIAYNLSKKYKNSEFIFCTISPYFKNNLKYIPDESKKYFGEKFIDDLNKYQIHNGTKNRAWFLVGDQDWNLAIETNKKASEKWSGESNFILVKNTGHDLSAKNYSKEVLKIITPLGL